MALWKPALILGFLAVPVLSDLIASDATGLAIIGTSFLYAANPSETVILGNAPSDFQYVGPATTTTMATTETAVLSETRSVLSVGMFGLTSVILSISSEFGAVTSESGARISAPTSSAGEAITTAASDLDTTARHVITSIGSDLSTAAESLTSIQPQTVSYAATDLSSTIARSLVMGTSTYVPPAIIINPSTTTRGPDAFLLTSSVAGIGPTTTSTRLSTSVIGVSPQAISTSLITDVIGVSPQAISTGPSTAVVGVSPQAITTGLSTAVVGVFPQATSEGLVPIVNSPSSSTLIGASTKISPESTATHGTDSDISPSSVPALATASDPSISGTFVDNFQSFTSQDQPGSIVSSYLISTAAHFLSSSRISVSAETSLQPTSDSALGLANQAPTQSVLSSATSRNEISADRTSLIHAQATDITLSQDPSSSISQKEASTISGTSAIHRVAQFSQSPFISIIASSFSSHYTTTAASVTGASPASSTVSVASDEDVSRTLSDDRATSNSNSLVPSGFSTTAVGTASSVVDASSSNDNSISTGASTDVAAMQTNSLSGAPSSRASSTAGISMTESEAFSVLPHVLVAVSGTSSTAAANPSSTLFTGSVSPSMLSSGLSTAPQTASGAFSAASRPINASADMTTQSDNSRGISTTFRTNTVTSSNLESGIPHHTSVSLSGTGAPTNGTVPATAGTLPTPAIVGAAVGSVMGVALSAVALVFFCLWRKHRRKEARRMYEHPITVSSQVPSRWSASSSATLARGVEMDGEAEPPEPEYDDGEIRFMDERGCLAQVQRLIRRVFELETIERPQELETVEKPQELEADETGCLAAIQTLILRLLGKEHQYGDIDNIEYMDELKNPRPRQFASHRTSMTATNTDYLEELAKQSKLGTRTGNVSETASDIDFLQELKNQHKAPGTYGKSSQTISAVERTPELMSPHTVSTAISEIDSMKQSSGRTQAQVDRDVDEQGLSNVDLGPDLKSQQGSQRSVTTAGSKKSDGEETQTVRELAEFMDWLDKRRSDPDA